MAQAERVILVGGGGFGRELASWIDDLAQAGGIAPLAGFIDDRPDAMEDHGTRWLGTVADYEIQPNDRFVLGLGDPRTKRSVVATLRARGARFARVIHPSAVLGRNPNHGEGVIMAPFSMNTADTRVGEFVTILSFSGIGHDASVGAYSTLSSHVDIMGGARVGEGVLFGSGSRLMPGKQVGDDCRIGAGVVVQRSAKPETTLFAPPAKRLALKSD